jgi:hypothetical protein
MGTMTFVAQNAALRETRGKSGPSGDVESEIALKKEVCLRGFKRLPTLLEHTESSEVDYRHKAVSYSAGEWLG